MVLPPFLLPEERDLIIIGAGPAGISGAMNAARHTMNFLLLDRVAPMEKIRSYDRIANYPGLGITTGLEFAEAFRGHLESLQVPMQNEPVSKIIRGEEKWYEHIVSVDRYTTDE